MLHVDDLGVRLLGGGEAEVSELDILLSVQEYIGGSQVPGKSSGREGEMTGEGEVRGGRRDSE